MTNLRLAQQSIHKIEANTLEPMPNKLRKQIEATPLLDDKQKNTLLKRLENIHYSPTLCHGDFHLYNVIMTKNNEQIVIDWKDATAGDFRADIYRTYLLYNSFSPEIANLYLKLIYQKTNLTTEEIFQWAPIIAGARLSENVSAKESKYLLEVVLSLTK